jgi:hypothetical protein
MEIGKSIPMSIRSARSRSGATGLAVMGPTLQWLSMFARLLLDMMHV